MERIGSTANIRRRPNLKILLLTPQLPYPPLQGTSLRNYNILRGLARRHRVSLCTFAEHPSSAEVGPLAEMCEQIRLTAIPERTVRDRLLRLMADPKPDMAHRLHSPQFDMALREILASQPFDIVQVEGIELARTIPLIRKHAPRALILFDDHNAEAELQRRAFWTDVHHPRRWIAATYSFVQMHRLRRFEAWVLQESDRVVAVSESDRQHLARLAPDVRIAVIPNSIDVAEYQPTHQVAPVQHDVVFTGKMDYRPNVDAVLWFATEIWPLIRIEFPMATWAIVGQKAGVVRKFLEGVPGVSITGFVQDVKPYIHGATVFVMPFRMGSGTRLKLIEAMAAAKAIVSTHVGAEGFPVAGGKHLLLANTAEQFARAVRRLMSNEDERQKLGQAAHDLAKEYDWRVIVPRFEDLYFDS